MPRIIETGLQKPPAPHAWAVEAYGIVQSVHVPIRPDGSIESGNATRQTEVTLNDLKATLAAAGASLADVTLIQIYLTSLDHKPAVDAVYRQVLSRAVSRPGVYCRFCLANTGNGDRANCDHSASALKENPERWRAFGDELRL